MDKLKQNLHIQRECEIMLPIFKIIANEKEITMVVKKAVKKTAPKKTVRKARAPKVRSEQSFHVSAPRSPFFTIAITRQTVYWLIISMSVLALGMWTIHLQSEVNALYDSIEAAALDQ